MMSIRGRLLFLSGAALVLTIPSGARSDPFPQGKKAYDSKCASCHGKDGKGSATMAKAMKLDAKLFDLTTPESVQKTEDEHLKVVADGKNKMPAYGKKLKPEEIKSVLHYIRGLAPKK